MKTFDEICNVIEEMRKDVLLTSKGTKTAARRVRKNCLKIRKLVNTLRKDCLDIIHNGVPEPEIAE
ncbi:MAG: hypothetical protein RBR68_11400 [Tenuifilaceae bacterium]|jgi:hypothetical protein|nr:hypothetical protein [Tenuifilaceae bacterium]